MQCMYIQWSAMKSQKGKMLWSLNNPVVYEKYDWPWGHHAKWKDKYCMTSMLFNVQNVKCIKTQSRIVVTNPEGGEVGMGGD